ncbi:cupin domain-containing protein [Mucilaginibacter aquariorum]|uniref:Cupin domain-containing protein n=1 Tax=Mucilaginibacter aquariorum TaxID=2967225 RepID=A0ABT1SXH2_9SPHI|nr:cupin domain-containing protein [Mucilaginibacter aquariorum]MCQ6957039.1 cupin domain-containing protein [Mucilaginibacter aquariorum]
MKKTLWLFGTELEILNDESQTGGAYDLILGSFQPGTETPLHVHHKYAESLYVIDGEFTVYTAGNATVLKSGDNFYIPQGTPHAVANTGNIVSKGLTIASPSGFARLIELTGVEGKSPGIPGDLNNDLDLFIRASEESGDSIIGPPGTRP